MLDDATIIWATDKGFLVRDVEGITRKADWARCEGPSAPLFCEEGFEELEGRPRHVWRCEGMTYFGRGSPPPR